MEELISVLPRVLHIVGYDEQACERVLQAAWKHIVGESIAAHSRPLRLRRKRLLIQVSDRTWGAQLRELSPTLLAKINRLFGTDLVETLECRVERKKTVRSPEAPSVTVSSPALERIRSELLPLAEKIGDPDLREAFLRAASRCLQRREGS